MEPKFMGELINSFRTIPNVIAITIFLTVVGSCSTTRQTHSRNTSSAKVHDSLLVDSDGNRYTIKLLSENSLWMTANLKLNIPGSYCYETMEENCEQYGRLYTWESARKGCRLLGEGWRLPTNDEWQQMAKQYGGTRDDSDDNGKTAYKTLLDGGSAGFNALLGGGRNPDSTYARRDAHGFYWTATERDAHGFYWTATERDTTKAWFYNFGKGSEMLNRHNDGEKSGAFSVRCMKRIDTLK